MKACARPCGRPLSWIERGRGAAAALVLAAALTACSGGRVLEDVQSFDYREAELAPPLVYPPGTAAPPQAEDHRLPPPPPGAPGDPNALIKPPRLLPPEAGSEAAPAAP
ncbi:MAG: hypothetical protein KatS3mg121_0521 [Gammaproteobacteria bacterium]|nr:MAG: hypothetical protein KatS3mg121_0521 [Gammaproteobacteria bacterium]